ncbi:hypothetical protein MSC49_40970 (plasmid) [Methylosinus sp. C49]|nr:hypothetical protein MSC49_40970 [Methylosinus sp. C49]
MGHDIMPLLAGLRCRKILLYHNITPSYFYERGSFTRRYVAIGLRLLDEFRAFVEGAIGDSDLNCQELRRRGFENPVKIPALRDFLALRNYEFNPVPHYYEAPRYQLLFVGRINPNKGQLLLIDFLKRYADAFDHPLYLTLVGSLNKGDAYAEKLLKALEESGVRDRVLITGHVSEADLLGHYRAADAFVCFSAHEGFGVPLLEAMAFDVPVIAVDSAAVSDTLGGAGILLKSPQPEELADQLQWLFSDRANRRQVLRGQRKRLADFERSRVASQLINFLTPFLPADVKPCLHELASENGGQERPVQARAAKHHYLIEGPCETSYSLAIVNRNVALALDARSDCAATLFPAEGVPGYRLNEDALRATPEIVPLLQPLPYNPDCIAVSIRNVYPMRPAGMLGDFALCGIAWEETEISEQLAALLNRYVDGAVMCSEYVRTVFRNSGVRVPARVFSHGVDHLPPANLPTKQSSYPFTFLHISSGLERKGIEELFTAYVSAFSRSDNVELIVKSYRNSTNVVQHWYDRLVVGRDDAPVVKMIYDDVPDTALPGLYQAADAVVLPTRGEGFCLPAAEAMFYGTPVAITGFSGQMEFCKNDNCYLIDYEFEPAASHLGVSNGMWAKPSVTDLAVKMRQLYNRGTEMRQKIVSASETASKLTWGASGDKIDNFVNFLESGAVQRRRLNIGWVTTWNTKCGIATFSEFILPNLPDDQFNVLILANHWQGLREDEPNVRRCWTHRGEPLDGLVKTALAESCDIVVFQYNYGFHTLADLSEAIVALTAASVDVYIEFHKTKPITIDGVEESIAAFVTQFAKASRIIVHTIEDVNRLKEFGLVDNVVKIPHGAMPSTQLKKETVRELLGFGQRSPIIGCYGFLLPPKGIQQLIMAFAIIARKYVDALLVLTNSVNDDPSSGAERDRCVDLVEKLGLSGRVLMVNDYLETDETMLLLEACDIIVFPYQRSGESASGAVRYGLSALRPVVTTPLAVFEDITELVEQTGGYSSQEIFASIERLLNDPARCEELISKQKRWLEKNSWDAVSARIANMMIGVYQDRRNVIVKPVLPQQSVAKSSPLFEDWMQKIGDYAFVRIAYQRTLGRDVDQQSVEHATRSLAEGAMTRQDLIASLENSDEGRAREAQRVLQKQREDKCLTVQYSKFSQTTNEEFVHAIYFQLLGRSCDAGGFRDAMSYLEDGGDRIVLVKSILDSTEFIANNRPIRVIFD